MTDRRPAPTIRDVARRAGVSTATVSRALSGLGTVRPETRDTVVAAAAVLGYRPSGIARSLKLRSTRTLGLLVTDVANPYFPEIVRAVEDAALARGHTLLLCTGAEDAGREAMYLELLAERRVDGIIIASSGLQQRHREWLSHARVPVVLVNCTSSGPALPAILSDNRAGGRLATEHLLGLGHLRLGHVSAPRRYAAAGERLAGIEDAVAAVPAAELAVVEGDSRVEGAEAATHELLDRHPDTTGILCYNDLSAIGALRALRARGLQVPGDVSVVGYDDIAAAGWVEPPLTTVTQQTATMGRWAVERLVERIRQPADDAAAGDAEVIRLPVALRVRASSAAPAR
jgi:DNA-binding LacI/PurR family transcriptional regulator